MEHLIRRMQDIKTGVEVKSQRNRFTCIPYVFTGEDAIAWLHKNVTGEAEEAQHLADVLCHYGYIFPVTDTKVLSVKLDNSPYRFQDPRFWPSGPTSTDNENYAIFLTKRSLRNKQKHGLEEHEQLILDALMDKLLYHKKELVKQQAEEQLRMTKELAENAKAVYDSQERAFWRVYRPPPGQIKRCTEGLKHYFQPSQIQDRFARKDFLIKKIQILKRSYALHRVKTSQAVEIFRWRAENYKSIDPFLSPVYPSNPWTSEDTLLWDLSADDNAPVTAQSISSWTLNFRHLLDDRKGRAEFKTFLEKEYSQENLRFWSDCEDIKFAPVKRLATRIQEIFNMYLSEGSLHEVNIDSKTRQHVQNQMQRGRAGKPSRFTFLQAQEQVFRLMMKDSYVRFLRSEEFQQLQKDALEPEGRRGIKFSRGFLKKSTQTPSPKMKHRGAFSVSEDPGDEDMLIITPQHSHSASSLRDMAAETAVLLRYGQKAVPESSMRKSETSPTLSGHRDRTSVPKGGSFHKKQQQQQMESSATKRRRSLNLETSASSDMANLTMNPT